MSRLRYTVRLRGRARALPLAGELLGLVKRREAARLLVGPDGEPKVANHVFHKRGACLGDFHKTWQAALVKAGFSHTVAGSKRVKFTKTFHDLRRTAARNLVRAGVRESVAMAVTGHVTRSMFDRYNITSTDDVREALEAVSTKR